MLVRVCQVFDCGAHCNRLVGEGPGYWWEPRCRFVEHYHPCYALAFCPVEPSVLLWCMESRHVYAADTDAPANRGVVSLSLDGTAEPLRGTQILALPARSRPSLPTLPRRNSCRINGASPDRDPPPASPSTPVVCRRCLCHAAERSAHHSRRPLLTLAAPCLSSPAAGSCAPVYSSTRLPSPFSDPSLSPSAWIQPRQRRYQPTSGL